MAEHRLGLVEGPSSGSLSGARAFVEGGPPVGPGRLQRARVWRGRAEKGRRPSYALDETRADGAGSSPCG